VYTILSIAIQFNVHDKQRLIVIACTSYFTLTCVRAVYLVFWFSCFYPCRRYPFCIVICVRCSNGTAWRYTSMCDCPVACDRAVIITRKCSLFHVFNIHVVCKVFKSHVIDGAVSFLKLFWFQFRWDGTETIFIGRSFRGKYRRLSPFVSSTCRYTSTSVFSNLVLVLVCSHLLKKLRFSLCAVCRLVSGV
jgi:hypothetical protein